MKVVVIIPTYKEVENIGRMLDTLAKEEFPQIKNHSMQILVVDSKSPDGTADVVREKMKKYKFIHLLETDKGGLGADYVKGMKHAMHEMKADAIIEFDADFQHDPKDIKRLVSAMDDGADYAIGSRYVPGGAIPKEWGLNRKIMSFFGSMFARIMLFHFSIHDMTSGMKLTRTEYLKKVDLDHLLSKYYAYKIHILHAIVKQKVKVVEVPIVFHERKEGSSKISKKDLIDSFMVVVKLRLIDSARFLKFATVGFIGYVINALGLELLYRAGLSSGIAAAGGAELAIISNFLLNNFWTFKSQRVTNIGELVKKFVQFNFTSIGAVVIQGVVVGVGTALFGDNLRQVMLFVAVAFFVVPYNYAAYNILIWKTWKVPGLGWLQKMF